MEFVYFKKCPGCGVSFVTDERPPCKIIIRTMPFAMNVTLKCDCGFMAEHTIRPKDFKF